MKVLYYNEKKLLREYASILIVQIENPFRKSIISNLLVIYYNND